MRIYIESTIPSYVVARPARELLAAARQKITKDWWNRKRANHELFASQIVPDEIADGEPRMARRRLELITHITLLEPTSTADSLAVRILQSGLIPVAADGDAAHIALATVHRMDILLTWNCRGIRRNGGEPGDSTAIAPARGAFGFRAAHALYAERNDRRTV